MYPDMANPGFGIFIQREVESLSGYCDVCVVSPRPGWPGRTMNKKNNRIEIFYPKYFPLPGAIFNSIKGFWFFLFSCQTVAHIKKQFDFDIIHAHRVYPEGFAAVLLGKKFKKPVVISARGSDINVLSRNFILRGLIRYVIKRAHKIIAVSKELAEKIIALGGEDNVQVMPKGVDIGIFFPMDKQKLREQLNLPQDRIIVLYVGNLVAIKNPGAMVEAALLISKEERQRYLFVMVGDGDLKHSIAKRIEKEKLTSCFKLTGRLNPQEIPLWMNAADMLFLPSFNEGMPNVLYEAMACGLPVIASRVGGIPEIIEDGKTGFLIDPEDIVQMKEYFIRYANEKELFNQMSLSEQSYIKNKKLNWNENSQKIEAVYQDLLN